MKKKEKKRNHQPWKLQLQKFAVMKKFYCPLQNSLSNLHFKLHPYFYVLTKVFQEF